VALAKEFAADGESLLGQPQGLFGIAQGVQRIPEIIVQMGTKGQVVASLSIILVKGKFDQSFDLLGLSAVKGRVGLEPGEAAGLLGGNAQGVVVPLLQMVDLGLEAGELQEIFAQGGEPVARR